MAERAAKPILHDPEPGIFEAAVEVGPRRLAVEREREIAKRIGGVRGPVMQRARPQHLELLVVVGSVELQGVDAARAFGRVEPASSE